MAHRAWRFLSKRSSSTATKQFLSSHPFGALKSGENVSLFKMQNRSGMKIEVINYGAHLRAVNVPDRDGKSVDVTIGLDSISDYEDRNDYFGCIAGRFCNRINGGKLTLNQKEYRLTQNNGIHCLHGGLQGFDRKLWSVKEEIVDSDKVGVALNYVSPDGEEGFPSICDVTVQYLLFLDENIMEITFMATTDDVTVVNLTRNV